MLPLVALAAEVIPPAPRQYFNDYAGVVSSATASRLNTMLEDFERATSSQVVVAIFERMQSDSSIEDYTVRVAQSWKVGQKGRDNGAVLFVFRQDRTMFIQVGYGLEGALPDALCKRIIEDEIVPRFRYGDFDAGLSAGVSAILAATKGEYRGNGRTTAQPLIVQGSRSASSISVSYLPVVIIIVFILIFLIAARRIRPSRRYHGGGWSSGGWGGGGGWSGGGGGGFSGGGGSFGGGGAGGRW